MDKAKVMGIPIVKQDNIMGVERIRVHYQTLIRTQIDQSDLILLDKIGAVIKDYNRRGVTIILPDAWRHIMSSSGYNMLIDHFGRIRATFGKTQAFKIIPRFSYTLELSSISDTAHLVVTDHGVIKFDTQIDLKEYIEDISLLGDIGIYEHIYTRVMKDVEMTFFGEFPEWKDPTAYWDMMD